jgi:LacI family transcriptional regulator
MARVSLKDIAKEAGVSVTTVSLIINNKSQNGRISPAVVARVNKIIKEKNFRPNTIARSLRTGKSTTIGLIVEDISNHFFATISKTIELVANENGYKVIYASTDNDNQKARELVEMMQLQQVEGIIITPTIGLKPDIEELIKQERPVVLFDRYFPGLSVSYVVLDNFKGAYDMTSHLIKKGYKNIAFITIASEMNQLQQRLNGYEQALNDHHLANSASLVLEFSYDISREEKLKAIKIFLQKNKKVDALFFSTNYLGIIGVEYMTNNKLSIPKDYGFVSFDDHELFKFLKPAITVVAQPIELLATEAINALLTLIKKKNVGVIQKKLPAKLIHRASE